ncbi:MAG: type VI secretion system baseplate subunit TssK, partial [Pseudomonadota bacterium]
MVSGGKVVWSEGMFLRTQHFQQQDARFETLIADALQALPYPGFGFRRLELDDNALAAGMFGLREATGHFPDGTAFSVNGEGDGLAPITVPTGKDSGVVRLGIPIEVEGTTVLAGGHGNRRQPVAFAIDRKRGA